VCLAAGTPPPLRWRSLWEGVLFFFFFFLLPFWITLLPGTPRCFTAGDLLLLVYLPPYFPVLGCLGGLSDRLCFVLPRQPPLCPLEHPSTPQSTLTFYPSSLGVHRVFDGAPTGGPFFCPCFFIVSPPSRRDCPPPLTALLIFFSSSGVFACGFLRVFAEGVEFGMETKIFPLFYLPPRSFR